MLRVGALVAAVPFFGNRGDTHWPRTTITLMVALLVYLPRSEVLMGAQAPLVFVLAAARELLIGFALGHAVHCMILLLKAGGEIIGQEMGFSLSQVMNPSTGESSPVMAQIVETFVLLMFFALNGHLALLRGLHATFTAVPVGSTVDLAHLAGGLVALLIEGFAVAVSLALPVIGILLVLTVTLLLLSRGVPQVNLMEVGYTARILMALYAVVWLLDRAGPLIAAFMEEYLLSAPRVLRT
jgi:flagellar biosynthetic protein FliR